MVSIVVAPMPIAPRQGGRDCRTYGADRRRREVASPLRRVDRLV
jgi:hypothetical protein